MKELFGSSYKKHNCYPIFFSGEQYLHRSSPTKVKLEIFAQVWLHQCNTVAEVCMPAWLHTCRSRCQNYVFGRDSNLYIRFLILDVHKMSVECGKVLIALNITLLRWARIKVLHTKKSDFWWYFSDTLEFCLEAHRLILIGFFGGNAGAIQGRGRLIHRATKAASPI